MKRIFFITALIMICSANKHYSQINCGQAINQLQGYVAQVNQIYHYEYWTAIPNQRCPACCDNFGQIFIPQIVQNCRVQMVGYLNNWYGQQIVYVNNWYMQLSRTCANQNNTPIVSPDPQNTTRVEDKIKTLSVDADDSKSVMITIPDNPAGFTGN